MEGLLGPWSAPLPTLALQLAKKIKARDEKAKVAYKAFFKAQASSDPTSHASIHATAVRLQPPSSFSPTPSPPSLLVSDLRPPVYHGLCPCYRSRRIPHPNTATTGIKRGRSSWAWPITAVMELLAPAQTTPPSLLLVGTYSPPIAIPG